MKPKDTTHTQPLRLLMILFFSFGFITALNDILTPHLKQQFELSYSQAMWVQFTFFLAYGVVSLPASKLVSCIGHKKSIVLALTISGVGCLLFYPAAEYQRYAIFLGALFCLASGITLLQVASNPYVAELGPASTASSRLTLTQACNSLGTTVAPYIGAGLILAHAASASDAVQTLYVALATTLFFLAILFSWISLPTIYRQPSEEIFSQSIEIPLWHNRVLWGGVLGIFLYVGAEVSIGSFLVSYLSHADIGNLPLEQAGKWVSFYWGGAMIGRFLGAYLQRIVQPARLLCIYAGCAAFLVLLSTQTHGLMAACAILSVGFFNSIMFPTIFTLAIAGLGSRAAQASGWLCTAIVGGAVIPLLQGIIADHMGLQRAFFLPILSYSYIAYYGWKRRA